MECTFCSCPLSETEGSIVPSVAMEAAIHAGFTPEMSPCWENMKQVAAEALKDSITPLTDQQLSDSWRQRLLYPNVVWRVCDQCFPPLFQYLPKYPTVSVQSDLANLKWCIPVDVSVWAIFAGYAGLCSVLIVTAPVALILGIIALRNIRANPHLSGRGRAIFAIAMGTFFTILPVIIILIVLLADRM